jgi:hypothetical protein
VLWLGYLSYAIGSGLVTQQMLTQADLASQLGEFGIPISSRPELALLMMVFGIAFFEIMSLPVTPVAIGVLWALPLAASLLPRARFEVRVRSIVIAGVISGLVAAPLTVVLTLVLGFAVSTFVSLIAGLLLLCACQSVAGVLVMTRATWLRAAHGMAAAHLSGAVTLGILLLAAAVFGLEIPSQVALALFSGGTLLALVPVLLIAWAQPAGRDVRSADSVGFA